MDKFDFPQEIPSENLLQPNKSSNSLDRLKYDSDMSEARSQGQFKVGIEELETRLMGELDQRLIEQTKLDEIQNQLMTQAPPVLKQFTSEEQPGKTEVRPEAVKPIK